jgi:hypothetical protein
LANQQNELHMLKLWMELIYTTKLRSIKTIPQLFNMWPCKLKLDESKSKHVNLAQHFFMVC